MAKVFLDTNYFIDAIHRRPEALILDSLVESIVYTSVLSVHIYSYIYKIKLPDSRLVSQLEKFQLVDLSKEILDKSLSGPTPDLEDNIQLHSAAASDCHVFLTSDAKLLQMKFFGKARVASTLPGRLTVND